MLSGKRQHPRTPQAWPRRGEGPMRPPALWHDKLRNFKTRTGAKPQQSDPLALRTRTKILNRKCPEERSHCRL